MTSKHWLVGIGALGAVAFGCSLDEVPPDDGPGGSSGTAGSTGGSGKGGTGGTTGGSPGKGGSAGSAPTAGSSGKGGSSAAGGAGGSAGSTGNAGGASGSGGAGGAGGSTGGAAGMSGGPGSGGAGGVGGQGGSAGSSTGGTAGAMGGSAGAMGGSGGGGGTGGAIPIGNPPVKSAGCGKSTTVTTGKKNITSSGQQRSYIIDIPTNYDQDKPYRLFYTSHWIGSTSEAVRDQNYYFLKPLAEAAMEPAIFVAPQSDGSTWQQKDHALFDDLLEYVKENLCIDTTRVFATGFSFGGMITYSLSMNHQKDIRAAVGIAPANYNIYVPMKTGEPIAWMQTTGMGDGTCPWVNGNSTTQGAKFIAIEHATNNGCTVPANIPIWQQGNHVCYDFQDCNPEHPTKVCTFNGGHTNIANEGGVNWIAKESWDFFRQF
jgi:poly(3-hydroxybutyrate) depolymerase